MIPKFQSLLQASHVPVATVWFPCSSPYCRLPKFQSLLYDYHIPVATVWFPNSSRYCKIPKFQSLLYDSQVPVETVWFPFKVRPLPAFRIILRTKTKFRSTVKDPVVVKENILCALQTEIMASQIRGSMANIRRSVQRLKGTFLLWLNHGVEVKVCVINCINYF
jgi:hypothetical protein